SRGKRARPSPRGLQSASQNAPPVAPLAPDGCNSPNGALSSGFCRKIPRTRSDAQEQLSAEQVQQQQPFHSQGTQRRDHRPEAARVFGQAPAEEAGDLRERNDLLGQVDDDGVGADDYEKERPAPPAQNINDAVKECQKQQTPTTGVEHERAGPQ